MPDSLPNGFSVIVCCYNSTQRLPQTLDYLSKQNFNKNWEIIIVDNCSTDDTLQVAESFHTEHNFSSDFFVTSALTPGLNNARKAGVEKARYRYILFCDDDNWLAPDFLSNAYQLMEGDNSIGALGGECSAVCDPDVTLPDWFPDYQHKYAVGKQADQSGDVTARRYLWGAGLVTRKTLFQKCIDSNFPFLLTDRNGVQLTSGGDTELCLRIILAGKRLYYSTQLRLQHYIPANRLTIAYRESLLSGIDAAHAILKIYYKIIDIHNNSLTWRLNEAVKTLIKAMVAPLSTKWDFQTEKDWLFLYTHINLGVGEHVKLLRKLHSKFARATPSNSR